MTLLGGDPGAVVGHRESCLILVQVYSTLDDDARDDRILDTRVERIPTQVAECLTQEYFVALNVWKISAYPYRSTAPLVSFLIFWLFTN